MPKWSGDWPRVTELSDREMGGRENPDSLLLVQCALHGWKVQLNIVKPCDNHIIYLRLQKLDNYKDLFGPHTLVLYCTVEFLKDNEWFV